MRKLRLWILVLPFLLFYLGVGMNILAVTVNQGEMPVYMPLGFVHACDTDVDFFGLKVHVVQQCKEGQLIDDRHTVAGPNTHLKPLVDWIQLAGSSVVSPGDCFLWLGDFLTLPLCFTWLGLLVTQK